MTPSNMIALGTVAPDFNLLDTVSDKMLSLSDIRSDRATVVMFICNHCPFIVHIKAKIADIADHYQQQGIRFVAISANDVKHYPQDAPDKMTQFARENRFNFPYLYDESQEVAKAYQAACTPDIYVFDDKLQCIYRGQFDDSRPGNDIPVTGKDLCQALEAIIAGEAVNPDQKPSVGCNIKWK